MITNNIKNWANIMIALRKLGAIGAISSNQMNKKSNNLNNIVIYRQKLMR